MGKVETSAIPSSPSQDGEVSAQRTEGAKLKKEDPSTASLRGKRNSLARSPSPRLRRREEKGF